MTDEQTFPTRAAAGNRRRVLFVHCHPSADSTVSHARDRAAEAVGRRGNETRRIDLYAEAFDPLLSAWERRHHLGDPADKPSIAAHADLLRWCDTLVLSYPTWWSGQPAMLKGWFDRVWVNGVAYTLPEGSDRIRPLLRNIRRVVVVTSHGGPKWRNMIEGESGKRVVSRSIRAVCSPRCRTTWLAVYGVDGHPSRRARFVERVERWFSRL
ncbi:MAG: NAD(P)H-dependent oxidoreductase [Ilumatobacteraceae bacterium]